MGLTEQEKEKYGNRCPQGYTKIELLGKGGCAIVWLAKNNETGKKYALKQFPRKKGESSSSKVEVQFSRSLFEKGG